MVEKCVQQKGRGQKEKVGVLLFTNIYIHESEVKNGGLEIKTKFIPERITYSCFCPYSSGSFSVIKEDLSS